MAVSRSGAKPGRSFRNLAILSGVLGLLFASPFGQIIYVAGMISVIGIPIALLAEAIPTLAIVIVTGYLLWRFVPPFRGRTPVAALAAASALLLIIPPLHNAEIEAQVANLKSGDVGPAAVPSEIPLDARQTLALLSLRGRSSLCDQVCLHILMSGQAARVLMATLKDGEAAPVPAMRANGYTLERRAECPEPAIRGAGARPHGRNFHEKTEGTISGRYATMLDEGYCLVATEATLDDADLALLAIRTRDFSPPSTISPISAETRASRAGIYGGTAQGALVPIWQQTSVSYSLLKPVLRSKIKVPAGLSGASTGWWRDDIKSDQPEFQSLADLMRAVGFSLPLEVR